MAGYYRKVIKITAIDSPNVQLGLQLRNKGIAASDLMVIPGVLSYEEYIKRRATWDKVRQCIGLDAEFYEGAENLLYPPDWLNVSADLADELIGLRRKPRAIGIDPAEGGDKTTMAVGDEYGVIEITSKRTPDTSKITSEAIAFWERHSVKPENVIFDRGGGGKQHADRLRAMGHEVRTLSFGESLLPPIKLGRKGLAERVDTQEGKTVYKNRRAELYGRLSEWLDPSLPRNGLSPEGWHTVIGHVKTKPYKGFAIPFNTGDPSLEELRRQLAVINKYYDEEGRLFLPPKNRRPGQEKEGKKIKTLVELIGHSPDEADAVVLMLFGVTNPANANMVGSLF